MNDVDVRAELTRKTLDTIEDLLGRHLRGEITDGQLDVGITSIFNIAAGLIDPQVKDAIADIRKGGWSAQQEVHVLVCQRATAVLTRDVGKGSFRIISNIEGKPTTETTQSFPDEIAPDQVAASNMAQAEQRLLAKGYRRLI